LTSAALNSANTPSNTPSETATPTSVRVMRNIDVPFLAVALIVFLAAGLPLLGWVTGAAAWAVQRGIDELAKRKSESSSDPRTKVGVLAGSMIARGWIVAGIIIAVGLGNDDAGLSAAVLFLATFTLVFTMTMAIRPYETAPKR
jgi:hypothetical protein